MQTLSNLYVIEQTDGLAQNAGRILYLEIITNT